jgi:hypothetical protein
MKTTRKPFIVVMIGLTMSLAAFTTTMSCSAKTGDSNEKERITVSHPEDSVVLNDSTYSVLDVKETIDSLKNNLDSVLILRENLISEVDGYIRSVAPHSKMSATNIIDICLQYEYDITMLLCQGHLETHFGTTGRNVFGIVGKRYTHPDQAVQDYVKLMSSKYIINRSTEEVLRAGVNMENNKKAKYAGNPNYGRELTGIRNNILKSTNILKLFNELLTKRKLIS